MNNKNNNSNFSSQIVDMLVDTTLKKHGVKLDEVSIDSTQKAQLKNLVESLRESVDDLAQKNNENKAKKDDKSNKSK